MGFLVLIPVIFRLGMEKARLFLSLIFVAMFGLIWAGVLLARSLEIEITEGMVIGAIAAGVFTDCGVLFSLLPCLAADRGSGRNGSLSFLNRL